MNGNGGRIVVLLVALLAIGILVLPSTVTLFAGQHNWYNVSGTDEGEIPCKKCHADIYDEYKNTGVHGSLSGGENEFTTGDDIDAACYACHRAGNITYASGDGVVNWQAGEEAHAASTIACMACHTTGNNWSSDGYSYDAPRAGGFADPYPEGVEGPYSYEYGDNAGEMAAHQAFVERAITETQLEDSNEACLACHTHIAVKINWSHARSIEFDVYPENYDIEENASHFNVTNWSINTTTWANATTWGNTTGSASTNLNNVSWPGEVPGASYNYTD
ncbi:MAG: cytochrome c3 family protein [Archaeoglobaceae archaeon]